MNNTTSLPCYTDAAVHTLPNTADAWARYARSSGMTLNEFGDGYELLCGPYRLEWLRRGFAELLRTVRNSRST